jgi:acyl-CoA synthetase (NDP forming)
MKRIIVFALACALAPVASAQLYKYLDKDGKTVYSDQPPPNLESKQMNIQSNASGGKTYVERDKEAQKSRDEARDKAKKSEQTAKVDQQNEERCAQARSSLKLYTDGGRIAKYDSKGERVFLGDQEIETERQRAQRDVDEACKK